MFETMMPPSYVPATYLVASSLLTADQLVSQFQDFSNNLRYISVAPELVFERLVASLNEIFTSAFEQERQQHAAALQTCDEERRMLELSNIRLKAELELGSTISVVKYQESNPRVGVFHTNEVRSRTKETSKEVSFTTPYPKIPSGVPIGLTMVDICNIGYIRACCYSSDLRCDGFKVHLDTWADSTLYQGECMWLEVAASDPDFQFGTFATNEDHPWDKPKFNTTRQIFFTRPYSVPPRVVVWLNTIDMNNTKDWRVKTYASNITPSGFTIHIDTWSDTLLYGAGSTWVAYPADKPKILSGSFNTLQVRTLKPPQLKTSGSESFGNVFDTPPRVFAALNMLDAGCEPYLRVSLKTSVGVAGMTWSLDSWDNSILYSAGASYIALG